MRLPRRARRFRAAFAASLVACAFSRGALALESDPTAARVLFDEGRKLIAQGRVAEACPKFEESLALSAGIGIEFNLADCWERIGRTASAWVHYLNVATAAKAAGQLEREAVALERAGALEPKLARLVVVVKDASGGVEITRDGVKVGRPSWGVAIPVDPGAHQIDARTSDGRSWTTRIDVPAAATQTVVVPELARDVPGSPPAAPAVAGSPPPDAPARPLSQRTVGVLFGGASIIGFGLGTMFAQRLDSKNDSARRICPSSFECSPEEIERHADLVDEAKAARTGLYVSFAFGGAALATGAWLYFTADPEPEGSSAFSVAPVIGPGIGGWRAQGSW